jgi:hypothetical protein
MRAQSVATPLVPTYGVIEIPSWTLRDDASGSRGVECHLRP